MTDSQTMSDYRPRKTGTFFRRNKLVIMPLVFIAPAFAMFSLFVIWPIIQSVGLSFVEWQGIGPKTWVGLDNYRELCGDQVFWTSLVNNLYWLALFLLAPVMGLFIALFLNQNVFGIRLVKSLFFFPFVVSQIVVGMIFAWFYDPAFGLLATLLKPLGIGIPAILADENWATFGIIAAGLWPQTAYCMILYLTGSEQREPRSHRGRPSGRGERLATAGQDRPAATARGNFHRAGRDGHRCAAVFRPCRGHDERRPLQLIQRAGLLHV